MKYYFLNPKKEKFLFIPEKEDRSAVIDNIIALRAALSREIPEKRLTGNLILGTWNIREFGNKKYGGRMTESLYYIAEIISRFDLIAIQEVRDNLQDLNSVCAILGNDWELFTTVVTQGVSGNQERLSFIYDKRTVSFRDIAGQIVLPWAKDQQQFARSPFLIRFQSGWLQFDICTAHIYYGKASVSSPEYKRRVTEIRKLVDFFENYFVKKRESNNLFIVGDFNIETTESETYEAATSSVFEIPGEILKMELRGTNVSRTKVYDQILYYNRYKDINFTRAGIFDYYHTVFNEFGPYANRIKKHYDLEEKQFSTFRTYQMSDHLPLWLEMNTDHADQYLKYIKNY